jgi:hypothetical protein
LAAIGLALAMIGAAITPGRRGENTSAIPNVIMFAMLIFVVYGVLSRSR